MTEKIIIYTLGPDGAGKTEISKHLCLLFDELDIKCRVSYIRGTHTLASVIARLLSRFDTFRGKDNPKYNIKIPPNFLNFWYFIEFVSVLPIYIIRFSLAKKFFDIIIGDRSPLDTIVWLVLTTRSTDFFNTFMSRFLIKLFLNANFFIYIKASLPVLIKRKNDMNNEFMCKQFFIYERFADVFKKYIPLIFIDTTETNIIETKEKLFKEILDYISANKYFSVK